MNTPNIERLKGNWWETDIEIWHAASAVIENDLFLALNVGTDDPSEHFLDLEIETILQSEKVNMNYLLK
jgi:hypothetical protein